ncbi:hypothetical protein [Pseudomonas sp. GZD-209]|uniref:hypothetical protein n=1 Tax=Pseudomonas sp. GZD-209 TaxID=3404807 RepID=UPI003BB766CC
MNVVTLLDKLPRAANAGLNPLVIPAMDEGIPRDGLGYNDLGDPQRGVALMSRLPEVTRPGDAVKLFWTATRPPMQPPQGDPAEPPVQAYLLDQGTIDKGWLSFVVTSVDLKLPANPAYPYYGYFYCSLYDAQAENTRYCEYREVLIDLTVPGGLDPNLGTPENEHLAAPGVDPQDIQLDPVSGIPAVTISIAAWPYMQADDQVSLVWNGVRHIRPRLLQSDVNRDVVFLLPREVVEQGGSGPQLPVYYEIRDRVQNYSRPSPITYVSADIDPDALTEPTVVGAESPPYMLDLDALAGRDVTVNIPFYAGFAAGDTLTLHWVGTTFEGHEVPHHSPPRVIASPADLTFSVPHAIAAFAVDGSVRVYYEVQPIAGGDLKRSRARRITVKGSVKRLQPPLLLEAVGDLIDLATLTGTDVTVRIPLYPGQMENDRVTLLWAGLAGSGLPLVYSVELVIPPGGEQVELAFTISQQYLTPLVDGTLTLSYKVFTPSLALTRASPPVTYRVQDNRDLVLPAPSCGQVQGTGDDAMLPVNTQKALVHVPASVPLKANEMVVLSWKLVSGTTPPPHTVDKAFDKFPFSFTVTNATILRYVGHLVQVTYAVTRNGKTFTSPPLLFTVGDAHLTLPAPSVREAPGNELVPIEGEEVNVDITYTPMETTHQIVLEWNSTRYPAVPGNGSGTVSVQVNRADIVASIGREIAVLYRVTHGGITDLSGVLPIKVNAPRLDPLRHAPVIVEAVRGELDVGGLSRDATLTVAQWPFMAVGQTMSLSFEGILENGSSASWNHPLWQDYPVSGIGEQQTSVELSRLLSLKTGSQLSITLRVGWAPGLNKVAFPIAAYRVVRVALGEDFEKATARTISNVGAQMPAPSMDIQIISSQAPGTSYSAIEKIPDVPNYGGGMGLTINRVPGGGVLPNKRMVVRLILGHEYSAVRFAWFAAHAAGTARFLSAGGVLLETKVAQGNTANQWISSSTHSSPKIKAIEIEVVDTINLDTFTYTR